jgi:23S rRNA (adenine2503-C2)-methyltransferase
MKRNLVGMTREELTAFAEDLGERSYRGSQLFHWIYEKGALTFGAMTDIAGSFRKTLNEIADLTLPEPVDRQISSADATTKFLFRLSDGALIETVYIPQDFGPDADTAGRRTVCVSTQVGCPLDCRFCATGTMGFVRNLSAGEIVAQVLQVRAAVGSPLTNVVFMGMGEPMLNYSEAMKAADILTAGLGIAARRITISTAGWVEGIRRMGDDRRRNKLAVSLHSVDNEVRTALMPVTRRYSLDAVREALAHYYACTKLRVTYEMIFFDGLNDRPRDIQRLIRFARSLPSKINVIPYHSIAFRRPQGLGSELRPSPRQDAIVQQLRDAHLTVMVRSSAGEDIRAACGQLAVGTRSRRGRPSSPEQQETVHLHPVHD